MNLFAMTVELHDLNVSRAYQFVSLFLPLASEALILELSILDSKRHPTANTNFQIEFLEQKQMPLFSETSFLIS